MANTKPTTRINGMRLGVAILGLALSLCAVINLFDTMTPIAAQNERIDHTLHDATQLPLAQRLPLFSSLRDQQEMALAHKPSEPYGWSRLAYLRLATQGNVKMAFAALRMSDLVSPYEAPQMPERALMWWNLRSAETANQQAYQDVLWQKAYTMDRDATWDAAQHAGLTREVGVALQLTDPELYEEWKVHEATRR